jgi:hypothetical protein
VCPEINEKEKEMSLFNRPKTINVERHKAVLVGQRNPLTGHAVLMTEEDAKSHRAFIREYSAALKPDGMVEIQLAQRLAQDTWRINRIHAMEENIFALGHSEPYANIESAHPEIHAATVQALTFRNDPKLFNQLSIYEQRLTKNFHANMRLLLRFQSLRQPAQTKEIARAAAA